MSRCRRVLVRVAIIDYLWAAQLIQDYAHLHTSRSLEKCQPKRGRRVSDHDECVSSAGAHFIQSTQPIRNDAIACTFVFRPWRRRVVRMRVKIH